MNNPDQSVLKFPVLKVLPEWVDFNGHMNVAYYVMAFDQCVDQLFDHLELGHAQIQTSGGSSFALEAHFNYLREVVENDPLRVMAYLLDYDAKRIHFYMEMYHAKQNYLAATTEQISLYVDLKQRKSKAMPPNSLALAKQLLDEQGGLPQDQQYIGRQIGIKR